jgi:hypothetical protein
VIVGVKVNDDIELENDQHRVIRCL